MEILGLLDHFLVEFPARALDILDQAFKDIRERLQYAWHYRFQPPKLMITAPAMNPNIITG